MPNQRQPQPTQWITNENETKTQMNITKHHLLELTALQDLTQPSPRALLPPLQLHRAVQHECKAQPLRILSLQWSAHALVSTRTQKSKVSATEGDVPHQSASNRRRPEERALRLIQQRRGLAGDALAHSQLLHEITNPPKP